MVLTLRVLHTTIAKQSTAAAASLPKSAIAQLGVGNYEILKYKQVSEHYWSVSFVKPVRSSDASREYQSWICYADDVELAEDGKAIDYPKNFALPVPFYNQVDNKFEPHRTCNTSSCAMAAKFLGAAISSDDQYYQLLDADTTDHSAQSRALDKLGIKSEWHTDLDFDDLDASLKKGKPIVIGILHRGTLDNPTGGHMIVVVGKTAKGDYIVNDPYGSIMDGYTGAVERGRNAVYSRKMLDRRWLADGPKSGWGRIFV